MLFSIYANFSDCHLQKMEELDKQVFFRSVELFDFIIVRIVNVLKYNIIIINLNPLKIVR